MLNAIIQTTLLDDVFREDPTTNSLEEYMASLFGHPSALLVLSGTMGNQLALRAHLHSPPHSVLADYRGHIVEYEAGGVCSLSQAMVYPVIPANGRYLTLADIQRTAVLSTDVHKCPTRVISLENTIGGAVIPLAECQAIAAWARAHDIRMHLDGARIWEAVASQVAEGGYSGSFEAGLQAYAECFDSVQACFSKGLGAPMGSILVGQAAFIDKARHVRKAIGGGMRATGIIAAPAKVAVEETFLGGKLANTHVMAKMIAGWWEERGGKLQRPVETNMVWLDLAASEVGEEEFGETGEREGIQVRGGGRVVCHYQICDEALEGLERVIEQVLVRKGEKEANRHRP